MLDIDKRWDFITSSKMCISCLLPYHSAKDCRNRKICGINECKRPHHQLMHKNEAELFKQDNEQNVSTQAIQNSEINCHISSNTKTLLKILPVTISRGTKILQTYALLDDASTVTLIDQELTDELNIDGPKQTLCLQWTNNEVNEQNDSKIVSFTISGQNGKLYQLRHVKTFKGLDLPCQSINVNEFSLKYPYIGDHMSSMYRAKPRILIGQDNWPLLVNRKLIHGPWNGPAISKTLLGWVIHGNFNGENGSSSTTRYVCHIFDKERDDLDDLHELVKDQWKIDSCGIKLMNISLSKQDIRAQFILDSTMKRQGDRFETGLLWKSDDIVLPESKTTAFQRLLCLERKMDRNKEYGKMYCDKFNDFLKKKYIKKLTNEESSLKNSKTWYLPHFGVVNPNKPNKLRIVFDASSKCNGMSLNDCLLTGPDLYNSLFNILLNFRIKKFAFVSDIKEMFLQVRVRQQDCCAQRILWRGMDREKYPDSFEISVVFFGSTSGPCIAQEAKNRNANDFIEEYPDAVTAITKHHYMDDYLGCADEEGEAKKLISDIIHVHKQAGFIICNWIANSDEILNHIDKDLVCSTMKNFEKSENHTERILGMWWNHKEDIFCFQTKFHKIDKDILQNKRRPTKREILKVVMSIFDPLGILSTFTIQGKILLQDIWRCQIGWDDELTDSLDSKWQTWLEDLKNIFYLKIPRQYSNLDRQNSIVQLHIFCDSSEHAYATVAYLRWENGTKIQVSFVAAKARVSSLKPISIPRLELQAALIGARLGNSIKNSLELNISDTFFWIDSKTVLYWIRSEARRFKVFVAQRLGELQEISNYSNWKYVPSKENIADEATKRTGRINFADKENKWLNGPTFLHYPCEKWPAEHPTDDIDENNLEIRPERVCLHREREEIVLPDPERFSRWKRILRTTAWMLRFIENCRAGNKNKNSLTPIELLRAETLLLKKMQQNSFAEELELLKTGHHLQPSSRLFTFSCVLDNDGLIRIGGRLNNTTIITDDTKRPIILDPNHRITKLIILNCHEDLNHHGQETAINNLRQKFWILKMRQSVKKIWANCQRCRNRKATPTIPIMGQLPKCRLEPTIRPFIKSGVNYFGPLEITSIRRHEKRYGVIFTCMVTRAIHLEIANDMSTDAFIHVFRQFGCRRGFPEEIYSDNGLNFKGAERELKNIMQNLDQSKISDFWTMKNTKWFWNPPLGSHMGGVWERLIRSVKKILKEILTSRYPQEHVLRTLFAECENIVNSRPLTHVSIDSDDSEAITPNHFLIGPKYAALSLGEFDDKDVNLLTKWRATQKLSDIFWRRWIQEYLPTLIKSSKWHKENRKIELEDIVILVDPNGARNVWSKGIVVQLYPAKDGRVRIVDVQCANGVIYRRPVSKLIVLDVKKKQ